MAQEFASDNSQNGLFSRLKLSNHRGFFSFIFVTLSVIFILITFAAVQQQQITQSKASGDTNICSGITCSGVIVGESGNKCTGESDQSPEYKRKVCCSETAHNCINKI